MVEGYPRTICAKFSNRHSQLHLAKGSLKSFICILIYIGIQAPPPGSHVFHLIKTINMKLGYHQENMEESGKYRIAFTVGPLVFFNTIRCCLVYQTVLQLTKCIRDLNMKGWVTYLDDVKVFSNNFEQHNERLGIVLTRLSKGKLKLSVLFSCKNV